MIVPKLLTVTRTQGNNEALKTGAVTPQGFRFDFEEVPVLVDAFRRMVRGVEFDVCEMALTTYLVAKAHGAPFTAVPVFLARGFHHDAIHRSATGDIHDPRDLEGRKVGVSRGYTVTTGVWARAILHEEYGVDLDSVTWVLSGDEHVEQYRPPGNVIPMEQGRTLTEALRDGELAAVVGAGVKGPDVVPLLPDPLEAGMRSLRQRGRYPINHLIVIKDEVLRERPEVATEVFDAFALAKRHYVERLRTGGIENPTATDRMHARVMEATGEDPLPYGLAANHRMLDELLRHAEHQQILERRPDLEDLFAPGTLDLTG
jgi:hypothetical protein